MVYPNTIDKFPGQNDVSDQIYSQHINAIMKSIGSIETELGTNPSGNAVDVKTRLANALAVNIKDYNATGNGTTDDYTAISNAITALAGSGNLYFPRGTYRIASNLTVATGIRCIFEQGAKISVDNGRTLTLQSPPLAGLSQIFSYGGGSSLVYISFSIVYPQWWGAIGDGVTDDTTAIQRARNALLNSGGELHFPIGTYKTSGLSMASGANVILSGEGNGSVITYSGSTNAISITGANVNDARRHFHIRDLYIYTTTGASALLLQNIYYCTFENLRISGFSDYAVSLKGGFFNSFRDIRIDNCGHGYLLTQPTFGYPPKANSNRIEQGEIYLKAGTNPIGIDIDQGNGNTFSGVCIEGYVKTGIRLENALYNSFTSMWIEGLLAANTIGIQLGVETKYNNFDFLLNDTGTSYINTGTKNRNFSSVWSIDEILRMGQIFGSSNETYQNIATHSSFEDAHHGTAGGTSPPTLAHEVADGHMDNKSIKATFTAPITYTNGLDDSNFRIDTTIAAMTTNDVFLIAFSAKATASIKLEAEWNGLYGVYGEDFLIGTTWRRYYFVTRTYLGEGGAGNNYLYFHILGNVSVTTSVWIDDVQVVKNPVYPTFDIYSSGSLVFPYIATQATPVTFTSGDVAALLGKLVTNEIQPSTGETLNIADRIIVNPTGDSITLKSPLLTDEANKVIRLNAGYMLHDGNYTNGTRPAANSVPIGTCIFNTDDAAPNWSDGTNWRDAAGIIT